MELRIKNYAFIGLLVLVLFIPIVHLKTETKKEAFEFKDCDSADDCDSTNTGLMCTSFKFAQYSCQCPTFLVQSKFDQTKPYFNVDINKCVVKRGDICKVKQDEYQKVVPCEPKTKCKPFEEASDKFSGTCAGPGPGTDNSNSNNNNVDSYNNNGRVLVVGSVPRLIINFIIVNLLLNFMSFHFVLNVT